MGFLSRLFDPNKAERALRETLDYIQRILDDEQLQVELAPAVLRDMLRSAPAYDVDPNGTGPFGLLDTNPIPVNGPIGELAYLSRLETHSGQRLLFHRLGSIATVDVFEAVSFDGSEWFILFLDMYHPRRSRLAPDGLGITQDVPQFSGFHNLCERFPYDFAEKVSARKNSDLRVAYIPISMIAEPMCACVYNRPLAHKVKLDILRSRLSSYQIQ